MFFVKSESKRKNILSSFVLSLIIFSFTLVDMQVQPPLNLDNNVKEAGWFWGRHKTKNGEVYRVFGITVKRYDAECPTYE